MAVTIDMEQLKKRCQCDIPELMALGKKVDTQNGLPYTFINRGSDILAVAHCDTVKQSRKFYHHKRRDRVFSPRLDDRLGVYVAVDLLPAMGCNVDVLLTDGEESGRTTGEYFQTDKQYNWIVEFDRRGDDVVVYNINRELETILESYFPVGLGSFSDISNMGHLNAGAFNVGIGYYWAHSRKSFCDVAELRSQMEIFKQFFNDYKSLALPVGKEIHWNSTAWGSSNWNGSSYSPYDNYYRSSAYVAAYADMIGVKVINPAYELIFICPDCSKRFTESETQACYDVYNMTMCPECGIMIPFENGFTYDEDPLVDDLDVELTPSERNSTVSDEILAIRRQLAQNRSMTC